MNKSFNTISITNNICNSKTQDSSLKTNKLQDQLQVNQSLPHKEKEKLTYKQKKKIISPLRYPGSKKRIIKDIKEIIKANKIHPELYVEPFAGGASIALNLLNDCIVEKIGLIELDSLVADFWDVVFFDTDWLVRQIETIEVTLKNWHNFKHTTPKTKRDRALTCFFLNRTSFSGIIARAGPIGGQKQQSKYKIDCRFPKKTLIERIRQAESLKEKVAFVKNMSWEEGITYIREQQNLSRLPQDNLLFYFDPPFFEKANQLYNYYFNNAKHQQLRDFIVNLKDNWILSYDSPEQVRKLYGENLQSINTNIRYSTGRCSTSRSAKEEIILTNMNILVAKNKS